MKHEATHIKWKILQKWKHAVFAEHVCAINNETYMVIIIESIFAVKLMAVLVKCIIFC